MALAAHLKYAGPIHARRLIVTCTLGMSAEWLGYLQYCPSLLLLLGAMHAHFPGP